VAVYGVLQRLPEEWNRCNVRLRSDPNSSPAIVECLIDNNAVGPLTVTLDVAGKGIVRARPRH
jgi:hypothetical protein